MTEPDNTLRDAAHRLLQYSRAVEDTSRGELRCMFCYERPGECATDCPWIGLQEAFDAVLDADAPEGQRGTTLQYDAKNRLSYVWLIWVLHEHTGRWELQGICTSEAELTPRVRAIKNDPNTIRVRTEVAFVDHLFAAGETVGDYANRLHAQQKEGR